MHNSPESFREDDGRHVSDWVVNRIVEAFVETHADLKLIDSSKRIPYVSAD